MAKIYGLFGSMKGKVADVVMAVRNGEQIVRKYQPIVSNPKTAAQVVVRARMKLLSQLSAVCAPIIAMPREGGKSSRNQFTSVNYAATSYGNDTAQITVEDIKLTKSVVGLPALVLTREQNNLLIRLSGSAGVGIDRMVYGVFIKGGNGALRYAGSISVSEPGESNVFQASFPMVNPANEFVVLAYGMRFNNNAARIKYGDIKVYPAETIAKLIVTHSMLESDVTLTETRGATSNVPEGNQG